MTDRLLHSATAGFEAARQLDGRPAQDRAARLHGHGFRAQVEAALPPGWGGFPGAEVDALDACLARAVAPLDHRLLNEALANPTDERLARWLGARLEVPGLQSVALQSTSEGGVVLDARGAAQRWRRYRLQAAHRLPHVPPGHKCGRVHGHSFEVVLQADAASDADALDAAWAPLHATLDHAYLNDLAGLENPTSEMLCRWLWQQLRPGLATLAWVSVYETGQSGASHDGAHDRIWKDLTLDSARRLPAAPAGDRRRRVHGHTYTLRLHLAAPLHARLGWTVDFGDVKERFRPIYAQLDHQPLHELAGLQQPDPASLARWIRAAAREALPELDRIDLDLTRGAGASLAWGGPAPTLPL